MNLNLKNDPFLIEYFLLRWLFFKHSELKKGTGFLSSVAYPWILPPTNPWDSYSKNA